MTRQKLLLLHEPEKFFTFLQKNGQPLLKVAR
jgi:hypothetical protein